MNEWGSLSEKKWGSLSERYSSHMIEVQAHQGPDDEGFWEHIFSDGTYAGLGSRRLAILSLAPAGHMPMSNNERTLWIAYNGEIYNFPERAGSCRQKAIPSTPKRIPRSFCASTKRNGRADTIGRIGFITHSNGASGRPPAAV